MVIINPLEKNKMKKMIQNIVGLVLFLTAIVAIALWLPSLALVIIMLLQVAVIVIIKKPIYEKKYKTKADEEINNQE